MKTLIITAFLILSFASTALSAEVTVDERSLLHVGASGLIGFSGGLFLKSQQKVNNMTDGTIITLAGTVAMIPGTLKETALDLYIDWGDMGFNALGAYGGAYLGVKTGHYLFFSKQDDTVVLNYKVRF